MLFKEIQVLGFDVDNIIEISIIDKEILREQIDLLQQFLAYRYPFDEFNNKVGVHDLISNEFIFIQP